MDKTKIATTGSFGMHSALSHQSEAMRLAAALFEESQITHRSFKPTVTKENSVGAPEFAQQKPSNTPDAVMREASNGKVVDHGPSPKVTTDFVAMEQQRLKRKRDEEEWERRVNRKINDEREALHKKTESSDKSNKELFALFNNLIGMSSDFNVSFSAPEIVVVGMQSDGKSSFIEGLLGFQFNIVDTNIGTRRPLIIQMINDQSKHEPYCRFRKEQVTAGDEWEPRDVPVSYLSEEIVRRTENICGRNKDQVSAHPIILRVEYEHCSNLTIIDTPGIRLGGDERLSRDIEEMVLELIRPSNRIIVCLESSTLEWANSSSRPFVQRVDPDLSRTILVSTKFDNRVKELRDAESADRYLAGEGIPGGKVPYYISLPLKRNLDPRHFKTEISECYLKDYQELLNSHFNEEKYGSHIGFVKLKRHLEHQLNQKYKESLVPTLQILEGYCQSTSSELKAVQKELQETDIEIQKSKVNSFINSFVLLIERFLEGSIIGDPDKYGLTLQEEKLESGVIDWPFYVESDYEIQNSHYKLYGGAQYERMLNEFEYVAHSIEFPPTSINEVASALGTSKSHNVPLFEAAASDIVQSKAKKVLLPLIGVVLKRCSFIFSHLFTIAVNTIASEEANTFGMIGRYETFLKELEGFYFGFIEKTKAICESKAMDDFSAFTKILDWDLMSGLSEINDYDYLNCSKEDTKKRVEAIMGVNRTQLTRQNSRSRIVDADINQRVLMLSGKLFAGVRYFFTKYIRSKFNAFFLDPMFQELGRSLTDHFRKMSDETYEEMFNLGIKQLKERATILQIQLQKCVTQRDGFKAALQEYRRIVDSK